MRAIFGIGINTSIDSVSVQWPDGEMATYTGLAVDKYWTVKQGSAVPGMAALTAPANNAVGAAAKDTLKWDAASGALAYRVQVSLDPTFARKSLLAVNATVNGTSYAYSLGRYRSTTGASLERSTPASPASTLHRSISRHPAAPRRTVRRRLPRPKHGGTNQPSLLSLKVNRTADASRYQWQVSNMPSFTVLYADEVTADTAYPGQFTGGQTFYWRVRGLNDLGQTAYSQIDTFSVMAPPSRTTLVSPGEQRHQRRVG